jgi:Cu+-exporting ATPase
MKMYAMSAMEVAHNFEISSTLITIILLGKYIETFSKKKTVDKLAHLASLKVTKGQLVEVEDVSKLSLDSKDREVEVEYMQVGDFVKVYPGSGVPLDGVLVMGTGILNEAMLTGESRPCKKEIGDNVFGGTILTQGNIILKV